jgi:protein-L-isoaspartate(D-aspartate) O-methyltransferase
MPLCPLGIERFGAGVREDGDSSVATVAQLGQLIGDALHHTYRVLGVLGRICEECPLESLRRAMNGWLIPPPSAPVKSDEDLRREREAKVAELEQRGLLRSERLRGAMVTVRRESFIPSGYRDHAYEEIPLPLPGERATISCPHSYPLFYEPLALGEGDRFLEVGVGSGYGTALAREVVGAHGLVVAIEIDARTLAFARQNLRRAGYTDVVVVYGDGGLGDPDHAPFDRICVTAACPEIPPPLIEQLAVGGRLIVPVTDGPRQRLTLLEKTVDGVARECLADVLYVSLQGRFGGRGEPP